MCHLLKLTKFANATVVNITNLTRFAKRVDKKLDAHQSHQIFPFYEPVSENEEGSSVFVQIDKCICENEEGDLEAGQPAALDACRQHRNLTF